MANRIIFILLCVTFGVALVSSGYLQIEGGRRQRVAVAATTPIISINDLVPPAAPIDLPVPTPAATMTVVNNSPIVRVSAPEIGLDAPIVVRGLDAQGIMETPPDPVSVVWYDFSAHPGSPGNVVMAGHVDYHNYGPAVLWELRHLDIGDHVSVALQDGSNYSYRVVSLDYYDAETAPVKQIVGPTSVESLTMITCGGTFDRGSREYDKRLVVRAEREQ